MCGIVVGMAFGKLSEKDEIIRQKLLRYFTTELLIETEERGKDATGAAILFDNGKFSGIKRGERVTDFLAKFGTQPECYGSLIKVWQEHNKAGGFGKIFLGHCRAGTVGDKEDNENNHPIKIRNLVGIHNGVIRNHDIIFKNLDCKRDGKVDSEAIFRLFQYYTNDGKEPFTMDMLLNVAERLQGYYAVTLFNADNMEQVPFFRDGRPVEFIILKKYGIVLAISEVKFWKTVHYRYERMIHYADDLMGEKLPSFIGTDNMTTFALEDESAILFDLSKSITKDTVIKDLGEWQKIPRTAKKWQTTTSYGTYSKGNNYSTYNTGKAHNPPATNSKDKDKPEQKKRVFDNISKKYVVKVGDKVVDTDKEILLPVDKKADDTPVKTNTQENKVKVKVVPDTEEERELSSMAVSTIEDDTNYVGPDENKEDTIKKVSETCKSIVNQDSDDGNEDIIEVDCEVVEVPVNEIPAELREKAEKAYRDMPNEKVGYDSMESIVEDIDISDVSTAESLGTVLISNRVFRSAWAKGYIQAHMEKDTEEINTPEDVKAIRREKHIAALKSMVVFLAQCLKEHDKDKLTAVKQKLANVVLSSKRNVDMDELSSVFNEYEKRVVSDFTNVIARAEVYKTNDGSEGDK